MLLAKTLEAIDERTAAAPRNLRAGLDLEFRDVDGVTELSHSAYQAPLQVVRGFTQADGSALAHLHNVSGGLLGGDELSLRVRAGESARVMLTTTGATRVYRPRCDAPAAKQINDVSVARHGLLEYVPDQIIPYSGARFSQRTTVRLAENAGLFWWEVLAPGREAHGEQFAYEQVDMKMDVLALDRPIACEQVRLQPGCHEDFSKSRLAGYFYWVSFYICRAGVEPKTWLALEERLRRLASGLGDPSDVRWSVSTLPADGLAVRCLAVRGHQLFAGLRALWSAAKLELYGREAVPPRKVN